MPMIQKLVRILADHIDAAGGKIPVKVMVAPAVYDLCCEEMAEIRKQAGHDDGPTDTQIKDTGVYLAGVRFEKDEGMDLCRFV